MSTSYIIVCRSCGSYRTEPIANFKLTLKQVFRYRCASCGDKFEIKDFADYTKQHPPDSRRCHKCDKAGVKLVEKNHRYRGQAEGEVVDLYKCTLCNHEILRLVQESPHVLYG
jgi:DNA-directed RNA polymerase subunit RPC12/RpoP